MGAYGDGQGRGGGRLEVACATSVCLLHVTHRGNRIPGSLLPCRELLMFPLRVCARASFDF